MKPLTIYALLLSLLAASKSLLAAESAATAVQAIAPYIEENTLLVVRCDLTRVDIDTLTDVAIRFMPDAEDRINALQSQAKARIAKFTQAGLREVYLTVAPSEKGMMPKVCAVVPIPAQFDDTAVRTALELPADRGQRIGSALVVQVLIPFGSAAKLPPVAIRAAARPELTAALETVHDRDAWAVLIPPPYTRRVIEELMPQLPSEMGGGPSTLLTHGVEWAALGIDLPPRAAVRMTIKSQDALSAVALRDKWAALLLLGSKQDIIRRELPDLASYIDVVTPKVASDRLELTLDRQTPSIDKCTDILKTMLKMQLLSVKRSESISKLKEIGLNMQNDYSVLNRLRPPASHDAGGKPLLSWRVYMLPYTEHAPLFKQFHLDEPWDSPHNKPLIAKMPDLFRSPNSKAAAGMTNYLVPIGNGALYATSQEEPKFEEIKDGLSKTIMFIEVDDQHAVPWTKPDDYAFDPKDPTKGLRRINDRDFYFCFCDGSVHVVDKDIDPKKLAAMFTRAGGEKVEP